MMVNSTYVYPCKVILVGDSGVGKTSIISRYINLYNPNPISTTGSSYSLKETVLDNNTKITFEIWDTAGQEKYRALNKIFYNNSNICFLVFDITNKESFNNILNFWYKEVYEYNNSNYSFNILFGIIGNKIDLNKYKKVDDDEIKKFSEKIGADYVFTSAKNGVGINEIFDKLGKKFIEQNKLNSKFNNSNNSDPVKLEDFSIMQKVHKKNKCCKK
jgi:small GTP-binding protein